jgi:uncharacterized protein YeeX (DUF496 family)
VDNIQKFGEMVSCQPLTTVGVALYMLNLREKIAPENKIAEVVNKRIQTIKENYEKKVRDYEFRVYPEEMLCQEEKQELQQWRIQQQRKS